MGGQVLEKPQEKPNQNQNKMDEKHENHYGIVIVFGTGHCAHFCCPFWKFWHGQIPHPKPKKNKNKHKYLRKIVKIMKTIWRCSKSRIY
jgi:hypothetical protein